jgi:hypothetical protein
MGARARGCGVHLFPTHTPRAPLMSRPVLQAAAAFCAGWLVHTAWSRRRAQREAHAIAALSCREAEVTAALSAGKVDGDVVIRCSRGEKRSFGVRRSDTALVLIDMQTDFLHPRGRLGQHYDSARHARLQETTSKAEALLRAARKAGLTIAHSRSHRYGAAVRRDLLRGPQPGAPTLPDDGAPQHFGDVDVGYELIPSMRALPGASAALEALACASRVPCKGAPLVPCGDDDRPAALPPSPTPLAPRRPPPQARSLSTNGRLARASAGDRTRDLRTYLRPCHRACRR